MKKLLIFILLFTSYTTFAQVKVNSEGDIIPTGIYPAVKSNNLKGTIHNFKSIAERNALPANFRDTGMIAYVTDSLKYYYLYNGITNADWRDLFNSASALTTGLTSTGDITLVDSTLTINDTIRYTIFGKDYTQVIPSVFTINSADSGYYRKDLIYADATGLHKLVGEQDTAFGVKPKLPLYSIEITTVDIYGQQIAPPTPTIITPIPNLQQVTNEGNTTTNPIIINNNSHSPSLQFNGDFNRSYYIYGKNRSSGAWGNVGLLFKNDVPDDPYNEHSGHFLQMYMGSTNSSFSKDGGLIRSNGTGGLRVALDSGKFVLGTGSPSTYNFTSRFEMSTNGDLSFLNYKNTDTLNVLATDQNGKVIMRKVNVGDIDVLQNTVDSSSFGIKKINGTVTNVTIYADGLTGVGGDGTQVNSDWNATSGVAEILNKPTIPAQFNPIAGTNMAITGTYPNLTFNSTASGGGSTYTASNGLTMNGNDVQLGGNLIQNTTIFNNGFDFKVQRNDATPAINVSNLSSGNAIYGSSTGDAIYGSSSSGSGIVGISTSGMAVVGRSTSGVSGFFQLSSLSNNTVSTVVNINNNGSDGTSTGFGSSIDFALRNDGSDIRLSNQIMSKWTTSTDTTRTSEFSITGVNNATTNTLFTLSGNGATKLNKYGSGLFTGTTAYNLAVDATGNIIEVATGGGGTYTASNGLTMVGSDVQLGGNLLATTTIMGADQDFVITNTRSSYRYALEVLAPGTSNRAGLHVTGQDFAIVGEGASHGIIGRGSNYGVIGEATGNSGFGVQAFSIDGVSLLAQAQSSTGTGIQNMISIVRQYSGSPTNGVGASIGYQIPTVGGSNGNQSNELISKWTDATDATRTSEFSITGVNSATIQTLLKISGAGVFTLVQGLTNYTDNAAAIAGGLTVGQLYRNGDTVQIVH